MKTSTAQAGKRLSILCAPTIAQTRGKRPNAAHPLADLQHGLAITCFDTRWPPPHEDKASRSPWPDHTCLYLRSFALAVPSSKL